MSSDVLHDRLSGLSTTALAQLKGICRGIEKEGLRVDPTGLVAQTPHPRVLGHTLTHPLITTDYSEALLELITPVHQEVDSLLEHLTQIHQFVQEGLGDEVMWAGSMPCRLEGEASIPIAVYGDSNIGRLKHVYRKGLDVRYGRIMQSIAGLHYNFSLPDAFWREYQAQLGDTQPLADFKSTQYFALIRNFRRNAWLLMYLFGASPALDQSFLDGRPHQLHPLEPDSLYQPYGTSLRMGDLGYHNNAQAGLKICFNHLDSYTDTLYRAMHTPYPAYERIGLRRDGEFIQLSTNILQIENEYYSTIRPKRVTRPGETPIQALRARGVEYVEVRCMDLDPFQPIGIDGYSARFLDAFLVYCLLEDSPRLGDAECRHLDDNFRKVVARGRERGLLLDWAGRTITVSEAAAQLLERIAPVAELLAQVYGDRLYGLALDRQREKVRHPETTPSARLLAVMAQEQASYQELMMALSRKHQATLRAQPLPEEVRRRFVELAEQSLREEEAIRAADTLPFEEFLKQYMN